MCVNDPNGGHLNDENMAHTVDKVRHADTIDLRHSPQVQMLLQNLVVVRLDYLHPSRDFVFSIWFDDFETRFLPISLRAEQQHEQKIEKREWKKYEIKNNVISVEIT